MTAEQFKKREIENAPKGEPGSRDLSGVEYLRQLRGVKTFEEMTESTKAVYLEVARCFPGIQVWACGSRVRGDYHEKDDYFFVKIARQMAGMKPKAESDYDFLILDSTAQPVCELPPNTEQVRARVLKEEMIAIPVYKISEQ